MAKNKMTEVAKMFGKKLGDVFAIRLGTGMRRAAYFSEEGLHISGALRFAGKDIRMVVSDTSLKELITGKAEIVEDE